MSDASLRISESLDLDDVLTNVLESARLLTGARYAITTTVDGSGRLEDLHVSGLSAEEARLVGKILGEDSFYKNLCAISEPVRKAGLVSRASTANHPGVRLPVPISSFLAVPIRYKGFSVGTLSLAKDESGEEFSQADEETLVMFASQVALAVANARRHRDEQRAKARLETLIDTTPVGVVVFDARDGTPISFNRESRRIFERLRHPDQTARQVMDTMTVRRADGREFSLLGHPLDEALSSIKPVRAEEIVLEMPDERSITVLLNATPIQSEEGEVESVVVTMQDMTPMEEVERLRAEFLGMVSHELRMPLTSIFGSAMAMMDDMQDLDPVEVRQFLRIILDQVGNMRDLIGDLLDMACIETGTLYIDPEPVTVAAVVDRARNASLSSKRRNNLDIDIPPDLPLVMADRRRVVQVIANLLTNAARHSPESSAIRVSAVRDGAYVEVSVADEGRGIPIERLPHLFEKFSRLEDTPGANAGLGLAICKGIVEAHGGSISAESPGPGLGARFAFTVPAVEEIPAGRAGPSVSPRQEAEAEETILVVDDDPQMLRYVRMALADAGYHPVVAAEPEVALLAMEDNPPDLVLLDVLLPDADGIELMSEIVSCADVPVIFISVYGRDELVARAFESGAADYIVKPFSPTELVARVSAALRRSNRSDRSQPMEPYVCGDLTIDYAARRVTLDGRAVELRAKEYQLLYELSVNAGRVMTHDELVRRIWGARRPSNLPALRTHLSRIRSQLGEDARNPTYLFSEPRVGYRMPKGQCRDEGDG